MMGLLSLKGARRYIGVHADVKSGRVQGRREWAKPDQRNGEIRCQHGAEYLPGWQRSASFYFLPGRILAAALGDTGTIRCA